MTAPLVRVHVHGAAGTIILNRPQKHNALSRELLAELKQALGDLHQERRVRAVVLTAAGPSFSAGMDLAEMWESSQVPDSAAVWQADVASYLELLCDMLQFPKPIIAAVGGSALAGGAGLVLASDLVVAEPAARFGLPEPRRGLAAGVVAPLLAFRVGGSAAARLLLTAETIDAAEAHRLGVFHQLVPADQLWVRATEWAEQCAASAPESLAMTKRMLNETIGESLATQFSAGAAVSATARTTEAAREGLAAFREKRPPRWV